MIASFSTIFERRGDGKDDKDPRRVSLTPVEGAKFCPSPLPILPEIKKKRDVTTFQRIELSPTDIGWTRRSTKLKLDREEEMQNQLLE